MLRSGSVLTFASITLMLALLALGCSSPPVLPVAPSVENPTLPLDSEPNKPGNDSDDSPNDGNGAPFVPIQVTSVSLQPIAMEGWASPLIVAPNTGATESSDIGEDGQIYISWAITNKGPDSANTPFSIDLLLDGIPVERWSSNGLFLDEVQSVTDWDLLPSRTLLTPGSHTLSLVVDSTDYVLDNDNQANTYSITFDWPKISTPNAGFDVAPQRLPNLSPSTPQLWGTPISITGIPTRNQTSDPSTEPRVQFSYVNSGFSSIHQTFLVYVYLDDVLVAKFSQQGLVASAIVVTPPWNQLLDTIRIPEGVHTLTIKLDPTNLITEANESDNSVSQTFYWGGGNPQAPNPIGVKEPIDSDVIAYTPTGWSGPLIISNHPGRLGALAPIYTGSDTFVNWAIKNASIAPSVSSITIDLLIGQQIVQTWTRENVAPGEILIVLDEPISFAPEPGVYEIQLRIQANNGTSDDVKTKVLTRRNAGWRSGTLPPDGSLLSTGTEITRKVNALQLMRSSNQTPVESDVQFKGIHSVIEAVYQTVYGSNLRDEPLSINILTDEEFTHWVDLECTEVAPTLTQTVRSLYLARCEETKEYIGYHTSWRGIFRIVVKGNRPPMQVLNTIAHELGHFRQSLVNPGLDDRADLDVLALREAQAYAHQILFFRTLEKLAGLDLLLYPQINGYEAFVREQLEDIRLQADTDEHARGQLVLWLALLTDPNLRSERTALLNNLSIPIETASSYFNYLVDFTPSEARIYVTRLMKDLNVQFGAIEAIALARLVPQLPYWTEGSPSLREIGLLMP